MLWVPSWLFLLIMRCSSRIDAICKASVISVLGLLVGTEKKVCHISCIHEWGNWQTPCNHYTLPGLEGFYTSPLILVKGGKPNITTYWKHNLYIAIKLSALAMTPTGICHNLDMWACDDYWHVIFECPVKFWLWWINFRHSDSTPTKSYCKPCTHDLFLAFHACNNTR